MQTAKLFMNGRSQAVRLPKELRMIGSDVFVQKIGEAVLIFPKAKQWEVFLSGLDMFTEDFMKEGREQPSVQEREAI
ncbi:MAG: antitoxin [Acidobacteriota bacterium]|nr:antitoxin [Acidobacteriota bacterium]